jgi:ABC-type nickel/cobalt efflux system permease component RcnA
MTSNPFRYYELVDWVGHGVTVALVVVAFWLVWREWRRASRIANRHAVAAEHQAAATDRLAAAIEAANSQAPPPRGSVVLEALRSAAAAAEHQPKPGAEDMTES